MEAPAEGFFRNLPEFSLLVGFMSSVVSKLVPLRPALRVRNSLKPLGVISGEYGGWVILGMFFSAMNYCTISDVLLGALS
jgi:hypothetical protein